MSTDLPRPPAGADQHGAWFDPAAAERACDFFPRFLRHTEGEWAGRPFVLSAWQRDVIRPLFGWRRADGTRLYRSCYVEIPRKNGKTEFAAGLALLILLGDGEYGGQVYTLGVDKDQARIAFNKASTMVMQSDELRKQVNTFKTSLFCAPLHAAIRPLASGAASKHGFSPSGAIYDELHAWPDGEMADVVHKGTAARRQPLEIYLTTAGVRGRGFGWTMHEYAVNVRDGGAVDPTFLPVIFAAGEDDAWTDPSTWEKANPSLGISVKRDYLAAECDRAQRSATKQNEFRRYHLNEWTEQAVRWLALSDWDACAGEIDFAALEERLAGLMCWGGLDLASTRDTTALAWWFPPQDGLAVATALFRFWLPEHELKERCQRDKVAYDDFARRGALRLTPGNVADYGFIKECIFRDAERFRVQDLAIDRWNATQLATELQEEGLTVALFGQGFASMSGPSKELERLVLAHAFRHGGQPVARWMAGNVAVAMDPAGNVKPDKAASTQRIDGVVAAVMALGRASAAGTVAEPFHGVMVV